MAKTHFDNLRVYQLAETVSDQIWDIALKWDQFAKNTVGSQLVRSADSIGANLAEGSGRGSNTVHTKNKNRIPKTKSQKPNSN